MTKVLFVASESDPFIKTGGLGDVANALPKYLNKLGLDVRVVIPKYKGIKPQFKDKMNFIKWFMVPVGWRNQYCGLFDYEIDGVRYYFIDNEYYFLRDACYGDFDDGEKFAYFDRAVLMMIKELDWKPDIIHCNDWQTGMIPVLYKLQYEKDPFYHNIKTVFSIHNLLFQGNYDPNILGDLFGLDYAPYRNGSLELYGALSFMKGAINYSDKIGTVSNTYANEIQTPQYGEKLDGLLQSRSRDLVGIVNGIDYTIYNPETDRLIYANYNAKNMEDKVENKKKLQEALGLPVNAELPMIGLVSRLTNQKGLDLITNIIDRLLQQDVQLVVLGSGDNYYEEHFKYVQSKYSGKVSVNIKFDDTLAHRIYAASDMFLMPSLFEPCGLGQLIALRYGAIPIVRETGGLKDTVKNYDKNTEEGNGFSFTDYNGEDLFYTVQTALEVYKDKKAWNKLIVQAMNSDNGWEKASREYKELYESLI
jgi:starch synthase